jgi:hypothetical protein
MLLATAPLYLLNVNLGDDPRIAKIKARSKYVE